jgi:hypothetical protein
VIVADMFSLEWGVDGGGRRRLFAWEVKLVIIYSYSFVLDDAFLQENVSDKWI